MKILITGASGFVGTHLLNKIDLKTHKVTVVVQDVLKIKKIFSKKIIAKIKIIQSNDSSFKKNIIESNPEICIHLASYITSAHDEIALKKLLDSNIIFGCKILDALTETKLKYFINTGSFSEYYTNPDIKDPAYLYSATKTAFQEILLFYSKIIDFKVINVLPYSIYGTEDSKTLLIDRLILANKNNEPIKMTGGKQILDFINVEDVSDFYIHLINNTNKFNTQKYYEFKLGTGVGTKIRNVSKLIDQLNHKKSKIIWGALPYRQRDVMYAVADITNLKKIGWYSKITLREGLIKCLKSKK